MAEFSKQLPLDYRGPPQPRKKYVESPSEVRWRRGRRLYRLGLFVVLGPIIYYFVANFVFFGKPSPLTPDDFVPRARRSIPIIVAIKEYRRDTGHLPDDVEDLIPKYLPNDPGSLGSIDKADDAWETMGGYHPSQVIQYHFAQGHEGWTVFGLFANGPIPLPPVTIPATQPATQP